LEASNSVIQDTTEVFKNSISSVNTTITNVNNKVLKYNGAIKGIESIKPNSGSVLGKRQNSGSSDYDYSTESNGNEIAKKKQAWKKAERITDNNSDGEELANTLGYDGLAFLFNDSNEDAIMEKIDENTLEEESKLPLASDNKFEIAFEGVCSLRDLGVVKTNKEKPLNRDQIRDNIEKLKGKFNRDTSPLYQHLYSGVSEIRVEELSWEDPMASQVISDNSDLVKNLPGNLKKGFMESDEDIACVVQEILNVLKDVWNNPAFNSDLARSVNEETYQSTVIVTTIQAVLKNLPTENPFFVSTSEKQSISSANRKGGNKGRRPDIMFLGNYLETIFELMYIECSRLFCTPQKKTYDEIKLWREANDGLCWVRQSLNPAKEQFGIVGVQVAGNILHLNALVRDKVNVPRYYHLQSAEIP
ncbi:2439_t:CDS:2, partial [Paraglomus occultum]